jgi:hypothetical protein
MFLSEHFLYYISLDQDITNCRQNYIQLIDLILTSGDGTVTEKVNLIVRRLHGSSVRNYQNSFVPVLILSISASMLAVLGNQHAVFISVDSVKLSYLNCSMSRDTGLTDTLFA